jgi:phosphatidylglycerophosphatase A
MSTPRESGRPLGTAARHLLAGGGLGYAPFMPGTVASLATSLVIHGAAHLGHVAGLTAAGTLAALGTLVTLSWAGRAERPDGRGDPGWVVADEVAGQAFASAPAVLLGVWEAHVLAFVLFRIFDILKPGPIRRLEAFPGAPGVLLDDIGAGLVAGALTVGLVIGLPFGG